MPSPDRAPLRVGVLGCAGIAERRMLPALSANPDVAVAAIASRDEAKARRFTDRFGGEPVLGYQRLLDRPDIDAVYIPLPALLHREWVEKALSAGKHVLSEKPLTNSAADTAALVALAESRGLALFESFMFLCHAQHAVVARLLAEGVIGPLRTLTAEFAFPPPPPTDARYRPDLGGGVLTDVGVYPIRTAQLYLGQGLDVLGASLNWNAARGVDLGGSVLLGAADGVTAHLTFGMRHSYRSRYALWGEDGRIDVLWAYTPPATHRPVLRIERENHVEERALPPSDQFGGVVAAFTARVRDGVPSVLEGKSVVAQAELVDRVRTAAVRYSAASSQGEDHA